MIKSSKGFTLVELLAVIVVLAIIALIGYNIVGNVIGTSQEEANEITIKNYADAIEQSAVEYYMTNGEYPSGEQLKDIVKFSNSNVECENISYVNNNVSLKKCKVNNSKDYCYNNSEFVVCIEEPNLLNGSLTPVIYDETKNSWVVADVTKKWYDYDAQEWANAIVLKSGITKKVGDLVLIPTEDSAATEVEAMYVWIPRYEYKIEGTYGTHKDGTAGTKELPGEIKVNFITDSQTKASDGYILHPAFTWDDDNDGIILDNEHISGIWAGKFETTGTGDSPTILPNIQALTNQSKSTQFQTAQKFSDYLSNKDNVDSHLMKNSEWGVVAYLSQSVYGKYGNNMYEGSNKEVYQNKSKYITGSSNGTPSLNITNTQCSYNDITDRGNGKGSCGGGASTTGNIYGVYDMVGGSPETVMSFYYKYSDVLSWGQSYNSSAAGFSEAPENKYFDEYTKDNPSTACKNKICYGHALTETSGWYNDEIYNDLSNFPWVNRGSNGIFAGNGSYGGGKSVGFRNILIISYHN